jgi:hypothetical protein
LGYCCALDEVETLAPIGTVSSTGKLCLLKFLAFIQPACLTGTFTNGDKEKNDAYFSITLNSVAKQLLWQIIREIQILHSEETRFVESG